MQDLTRVKIQDLIKQNRKSIKNKGAKIAWAADPFLRKKIKIGHENEAQVILSMLRAWHKELMPYVLKIKSQVSDITEQTHICAIYLLMCHIFENLNSFFLLAEQGKHSAAGNLLRMIQEAHMTINLFAIDYKNDDRTNIEKWFSGNIISHGIGREKVGKHFEEKGPLPEVNRKKLDAHIYQVESQTSHNAYISVLESISPFTEDFDFDGYTGFYRIISYLKYTSTIMTMCNNSLRMTNLYVLKNKDDEIKLNEILIRYDPHINDNINITTLKDFIK